MRNKTKLTPVFTAALSLFLSACTLIPRYERPSAPIAADWPSVSGSNSGSSIGAAASDIEWQSFFSDPKLKQFISAALQNNRDLRIAALNIEQARAQFQIRRADQLPTLNAQASGLRQPNSNGNGSITSLYTAGLGITAYELDFFGRVASLKDAALAQYLATEEGRKSAQISLITLVANSYLSVLADTELLTITEQALVTRQESLRLGKLRFDNGVISELDVRLAESLLEVAKATQAQLVRQRALNINTLTLLLGQPLTAEMLADMRPSQGLADVAMMVEVPAGLPSDLLTRRPDVRQAEQLLRASNANIGAARAAFFPRIALTASAGSASNSLSGLFKSGTYGWTLAPSLVLPIFDFGRNSAGLDNANASRDIAIAQYEKSIQTAFKEVADALAGRATLGEQLRATQAQANAEGARFKLSDLRYQNGIASQLDLLDAQRSLFAARQAVVQIRLAQLQSQVTLYKTLGGGWKDDATSAAVLTR